MPFSKIKTRAHTFMVPLTDAESALLDIWAKDHQVCRDTAVYLILTQAIMRTDLVSRLHDHVSDAAGAAKDGAAATEGK